MASETLHVGDLTAIVSDNEPFGGGRAGYNGIRKLVHRTLPGSSLFGISGLNFEHIFAGEQDQLALAGGGRIFFAPQNHPMTFCRIATTGSTRAARSAEIRAEAAGVSLPEPRR